MTWLYGWRAILPLFVAQFSVGYTLFEPAPLELTQYIAGAFVGATAAYIGCELMRRTGRDVYAYTGARLNWREFIFIGFIASIFNALGNVFVYEGFIAPKNILSTISGYLIGDTLGVAVALVLSMYVVRLVRLYKMNRPA